MSVMPASHLLRTRWSRRPAWLVLGGVVRLADPGREHRQPVPRAESPVPQPTVRGRVARERDDRVRVPAGCQRDASWSSWRAGRGPFAAWDLALPAAEYDEAEDASSQR